MVTVASIHSLDEPVGTDEERLVISGTLSSSEDIEANYIEDDLSRILWKQVEKLEEQRQQWIVKKLYMVGKS